MTNPFLQIPKERTNPFLLLEEVEERGIGSFTPADSAEIEKSEILSETLDLPFSAVRPNVSEISQQFSKHDKDWFSTATNSFKRGIGSTYAAYGRAAQLAGFEDVGDIYMRYGRRLEKRYAPTIKPEEFTWDRVIDPDWWATNVSESVPFTLSLIPAAIVAAYGGSLAAGAIGLGTFGSSVLSAIGAGVTSRALESGLEAASSYDEALERGENEEEAARRADFVFKGNLIPMTGVDVAQWLVAFTPMGRFGATGPLAKRIAAAALVKLPAIAAMEAGEEMYQEAVQQMARGERVSLTPGMTEAGVIGAIFGLGMGGTGSVYTAITGMVKSTADEELLAVYEEEKASQLTMGKTEEEAEIAALDAMAETPEGKAHVEKVMQEIVDMAEGEGVLPEVKEEDVEKMGEEEEIADEEIRRIGEGEEALDVIGEKLEEVAPVKELKVVSMIKEDVALRAAVNKVEKEARRAYKGRLKETPAALERAKREFRDILLKAKIKAEVFAFKEGFRVGGRLTGKHLIQGFKDTQIAVKESRTMLEGYIKENLPPALHGKFINALIKDMTKSRQASIFLRVEKLRAKEARKDVLKDIEELKKPPKGIALSYQKGIKELLGDLDTKKITPKTLRKLEGLKDFIEREGIPSGISTKTLDKLRRLEMRRAEDMTTEELKVLADTASLFRELGKLKMELKYKYDERVREVALAKLLADTHNLDPTFTGKETLRDKVKRGAMYLYLETLQSPRVFDMMDGYGRYKKENTKFGKRFIEKETEALLRTRTLVDSAVQELIDLGVAEITEEQQVRIMINIRHQEGARDQVRTLLEKYEMDEVPPLTEQEQGMIEVLKKYTNKDAAKIAAIFEEAENKEFVWLENYILPLYYEKQMRIIPSESIEQTRYRTTQVFKGMTEERQRGVRKIPRVDVLGVFEQAINAQQWYIHIQPEIENVKYLVKDRRYVKKAGELVSDYWKDHLDMVSRRGNAATVSYSPFSVLLREFRFNLSKAILGYKASSVIMQVFALIDATAFSQGAWGTSASLEITKELTKAFVIPRYANEIRDVSPALQVRAGGEVAIRETLERVGRSNSISSKFIRGGLSLLQRADLMTAAGVQQGIQNVLERRGVENAHEEAEFLMSLVSSNSEVTFRPHILARGEASKTWFTFQTFFLNRWGIIAHDLIQTGLVKGDWKAKYAAMMGLAIIVAGAIAEDEARKVIYELIARRKLRDQPWPVDALMAIPYNIPYFGRVLEAQINGRSADIPIIRVMQNLFKGKNVVTGKTTEAKTRGLMKSLEAVSSLQGIPGTAQFFDVMEGIFLPEKTGKKRKKPTRKKPKRR